jgi:hypothetical protein
MVVVPAPSAEALAVANAELGEHKVLVPAVEAPPVIENVVVNVPAPVVEDASFVLKLKKSYRKVQKERDALKEELETLKKSLKEKEDKEEALRLKRNEASKKSKAKLAEKKKAEAGAGTDIVARLEAVEKKVAVIAPSTTSEEEEEANPVLEEEKPEEEEINLE